MIEDDMYRASSQYRYWSYTQQSLNELRQTTNRLASERVKVAFRRAREGGSSTPRKSDTTADDEQSTVDTLTVEEELKIVQWGCGKIIEMGQAMTPPIPMAIVATAIQYLRRFYLTNSPMTYHPKQIMMCALFLATKSDHWHISLHKFVAQLDNASEEDIKAPEFLLMQGLRFTLDVRHPMKGLDGGVGDMQALSRDHKMPFTQNYVKGKTEAADERRIGKAADTAKHLLRTAAQMTDAYFLYTPAQIWLGAMGAADSFLVAAYLDAKFPGLGPGDMKPKMSDSIRACSDLLKSYKSPADDAASAKEMKRIGKKLKICQNPEKLDIVAVAKAKAAEKREGGGNDSDATGAAAEKVLKKRKLERERLEKDGDVFGPDLKSVA